MLFFLNQEYVLSQGKNIILLSLQTSVYINKKANKYKYKWGTRSFALYPHRTSSQQFRLGMSFVFLIYLNTLGVWPRGQRKTTNSHYMYPVSICLYIVLKAEVSRRLNVIVSHCTIPLNDSENNYAIKRTEKLDSYRH